MAHHDLKVWPEPYLALVEERKTWEARRNDRDYRVGDTLTLHMWDPVNKAYVNAPRLHYVVLDVQSKFLEPGYVGLSLRELESNPVANVERDA